MNTNDRMTIESKGWTVECESPLEIRHEDGSFATLNAAEIVIEYIKAGGLDPCPAVNMEGVSCCLNALHNGNCDFTSNG